MEKKSNTLNRTKAEVKNKWGSALLKMSDQLGSIAPKQTVLRSGAECYQSLKANLLNRYPDQCIKTLLFCSTAHGDGSTTTAVNFAKMLAGECRVRVLLVDTNFRTPRLHDLFQIKNSPGLSDYLTNGTKPGLPVVKGRLDKLFVLPCGTMRSVPVRLFETSTFDRFLQSASDQFDYVILDTPPIPAFAESQIICPKVDGAVLVVGAGKTRKQVARRAKKELEAAGGKVLGVVINRRKFHIPKWLYERL